MTDFKKNIQIDLYALFDVDIAATPSEVRKAYRRKALECHPDKNPDNPKAAELFQELSNALKILLDESARSAYDKVLRARKETEIRFKQLDTKRQKLKADLEARERFANDRNVDKRSPEEIFQNEIERLRKEGSKLLEEEQELMKRQLYDEQKSCNKFNSAEYRIRIKWSATKTDESNGGYNEINLRKYLQKYGDIVALIISAKKKGSAMVEFNTKEAAEMAVAYEKGNLDNPLELNWVSQMQHNSSTASTNSKSLNSDTIKSTDFESIVLMRMRQAEERKRLIEDMMKENY